MGVIQDKKIFTSKAQRLIEIETRARANPTHGKSAMSHIGIYIRLYLYRGNPIYSDIYLEGPEVDRDRQGRDRIRPTGSLR